MKGKCLGSKTFSFLLLLLYQVQTLPSGNSEKYPTRHFEGSFSSNSLDFQNEPFIQQMDEELGVPDEERESKDTVVKRALENDGGCEKSVEDSVGPRAYFHKEGLGDIHRKSDEDSVGPRDYFRKDGLGYIHRKSDEDSVGPRDYFRKDGLGNIHRKSDEDSVGPRDYFRKDGLGDIHRKSEPYLNIMYGFNQNNKLGETRASKGEHFFLFPYENLNELHKEYFGYESASRDKDYFQQSNRDLNAPDENRFKRETPFLPNNSKSDTQDELRTRMSDIIDLIRQYERLSNNENSRKKRALPGKNSFQQDGLNGGQIGNDGLVENSALADRFFHYSEEDSSGPYDQQTTLSKVSLFQVLLDFSIEIYKQYLENSAGEKRASSEENFIKLSEEDARKLFEGLWDRNDASKKIVLSHAKSLIRSEEDSSRPSA